MYQNAIKKYNSQIFIVKIVALRAIDIYRQDIAYGGCELI